MKKISVALATLAILLAMAVVAGAGEYFNPAEQKEIRRTVRAVFPRAEVDFKDTEIKGAGVLIGPLPDGSNLFIHANTDAEILAYRLPVEYREAATKIIEKVYSIVDNWPARDPRVLGSDLLERQGIKE